MKAILVMLIMLCAAVSAVAQDAGWIGIQVDDQRDRGAIVRRVEPDSRDFNFIAIFAAWRVRR